MVRLTKKNCWRNVVVKVFRERESEGGEGRGCYMCILNQEKEKKTLKVQLQTQHMHYLCEALSCDSLMTNPKGRVESVVHVGADGVWDLYPFSASLFSYTLSVLVTLLKIAPLISRSLLSEPSPSD